ncbi:hypothetical protein EW145_g6233 [Phellinidium pouzarii]|uniref:Fungal-type protein kinase domain-containing protein n=1 Tax=Phellinidium pouzarii TaxID=167371 RepID=A0A4S4KXT3_9AGAM|nr:hypothetical protein EW145_g6233 [Phellinidium pouzarii]
MKSDAETVRGAIDVPDKLDKNNEFYPRELYQCLNSAFEWQEFIDIEQDDAFKQAFWEIVQGHCSLYTCENETKHSDLSVKNLNFRVVEGAIRGVLNDWDLAKVGDSARALPKRTRTGTLPFMSADLLEAWALLLPGRSKAKPLPDHIERFDWESMFYVLFWIACHYDDGKDVNPMALNDWVYPDRAVLPAIKRDLLLLPDYGLITEYFLPLAQTWLDPLCESFSKGYNAQNRHNKELSFKCVNPSDFNNETLGGHVTYEAVWKIFKT